MHELSIAEDITGTIEQTLGGPQKLKTVFLTIGPLSGISPDALEFCFGEVASRRGLGEPSLAITTPRARILCSNCSRIYETDNFYDHCPDCGSFDREIRSGTEFSVDSVELMEE